MAITRQEHGFTLVEVLVALGVFSIAAMSLAHLGNETLVGARHVDQRFLATVEADNQIAEIMAVSDTFAPGIQSGTSVQRGRALAWTRTIAATDRQNLFAVQVIVSDAETDQQLVTRQTLVHRAAP
ncbi:MAG: prepilin-type cleavage/methylation domain-containing protein [Hyphomonas sp.]|nr:MULTISPECIES: type II secretion system minor pseudopilin GspI [Hyphomonas]KCZ62283.1 hypothetical protein HY36_16060 [Hyphomonas atlantica]MAH92426.1 prepilin-type cleavage/methylation domain-containing protein [Hyphomonas sp.]|tara:strand:- start:291 stop:668 length:378 start_codon:yes stop_codon:yes gene_type:complete